VSKSTQDIWDNFEKWKDMYTYAMEDEIEKYLEDGYSDSDFLFIAMCDDLAYDMLEVYIDLEEVIRDRVQNKIKFLRGYLVDISEDGADFMNNKSKFLSAQLPYKCDNAYGIWLRQGEDNEEAGGYFGYQGNEMNVFCKNIEDIDLASMRNIQPFDKIFIRRPKGEKWTLKKAKEIRQLVKDDLEFDYDVKVKLGKELFDHDRTLLLNVVWE